MKRQFSISSIVVYLSILLLTACESAVTPTSVAVLPTASPQANISAAPTLTPTPMPTSTPTPTLIVTLVPTATPTPFPTATARPTSTPTPSPTATATPYPVPEIQPISTNVDIVAAYYLTGWGQTNRGRSEDWRLPAPFTSLLGPYKSGDPVVADWHIKMALENGINTFIIPTSRPAAHYTWEKNFEDGLLQAHFSDQIQFAMMFNNSPWWDQPLDGIDRKKLTQETINYIALNYFSHPNYLHVEGKPVLVLFQAFIFRDRFGIEELTGLVADIRSTAKKAGYEVYLIGDLMTDDYRDQFNIEAMEFFDATTSYVHVQAGAGWQHPNGIPTVISPYSEMVSGYINDNQYFTQLASRIGVDFIPAATTGFDNSLLREAGVDNWISQRTEPSPELYAKLLEGVATNISYPSMIIVGAWNEFQEGWVLEPSQEARYAYLEQVRQAFGIEPPTGWPKNVEP
jgi:hypothetical protein